MQNIWRYGTWFKGKVLTSALAEPVISQDQLNLQVQRIMLMAQTVWQFLLGFELF